LTNMTRNVTLYATSIFNMIIAQNLTCDDSLASCLIYLYPFSETVVGVLPIHYIFPCRFE
jgi:hypothetical protein